MALMSVKFSILQYCLCLQVSLAGGLCNHHHLLLLGSHQAGDVVNLLAPPVPPNVRHLLDLLQPGLHL